MDRIRQAEEPIDRGPDIGRVQTSPEDQERQDLHNVSGDKERAPGHPQADGYRQQWKTSYGKTKRKKKPDKGKREEKISRQKGKQVTQIWKKRKKVWGQVLRQKEVQEMNPPESDRNV